MLAIVGFFNFLCRSSYLLGFKVWSESLLHRLVDYSSVWGKKDGVTFKLELLTCAG